MPECGAAPGWHDVAGVLNLTHYLADILLLVHFGVDRSSDEKLTVDRVERARACHGYSF